MGTSTSNSRGDEEEWEDNYKDGPPWIFKGKALYQLQLVKASVARKFIPPELRIVEAFGYTLGGLYFAQYDSSPAGRFDELVALAGIVWNPPTSCAWAAQVLVDTPVAVRHGLNEVGLPSRLARFQKSRLPAPKRRSRERSRIETPVVSNQNQAGNSPPEGMEDGPLRVTIDELGSSRGPQQLASITLPKDRREGVWAGPRIKMFLPSFSGKTVFQPNMLKYSCELHCNIRPVQAAKVETPSDVNTWEADSALRSVLSGRPIVSLVFDNMEMSVEKPAVVSTHVEMQTSNGKKRGRRWVPAFGALRWGWT